jgi:hypothetical protein
VPQRTELAVTDGRPPPADLPHGEFVLWPTGNGDEFTIGRADPRILISAELLSTIDIDSPHISLDLPAPKTFVGALLKIRGVNRTVIYAITEYLPRVHGYIGQWPG